MIAALVMSLMMATTSPIILTVPIDPIETQKIVWIEALHQCENPEHIEKIIDSNGYYSYHDFMFQMRTWVVYGKKLGATKENIGDGELQRKVVRDMLDKGLWRHWYNCSKLIQKTLGFYPS